MSVMIVCQYLPLLSASFLSFFLSPARLLCVCVEGEVSRHASPRLASPSLPALPFFTTHAESGLTTNMHQTRRRIVVETAAVVHRSRSVRLSPLLAHCCVSVRLP